MSIDKCLIFALKSADELKKKKKQMKGSYLTLIFSLST